MEIDQFAAGVAHEICNAGCFAFTGEGPKPHSAQCESAAKTITHAIRQVCDPLQAEIDRLRGEIVDSIGAITRMHDHCRQKHAAIEAGTEKSKMGAALESAGNAAAREAYMTTTSRAVCLNRIGMIPSTAQDFARFTEQHKAEWPKELQDKADFALRALRELERYTDANTTTMQARDSQAFARLLSHITAFAEAYGAAGKS